MALLLSVGASGLRASHGYTFAGSGHLIRWPLTWLALRTTRTTHVGDVITGRKGRSLGRCQRTLGSSGNPIVASDMF